MPDFALARRNMLECQLRSAAITEPRLMAALAAMPRERFLPKEKHALAYGENPVSIAPGRYLLAPLSLGVLLLAAEIKSSDVVLVIGAGDGYMAAITAKLTDTVIAVESDPALAASAAAALNGLDIDNVALVSGPLPEGYAKQAPYHVIVVNGAIEAGLDRLTSQLANGGRLVCVEYDKGIGRARIYRRDDGALAARTVRDLNAPILPGFEKAPVFSF